MRPKVLTLWQPWALLFAHGIKQYETRPKSTSYTGTYLIHAAGSMNKISKEVCNEEFFADALTNLGVKSYKDLQTGVILGAYEQERCLRLNGSITLPLFGFSMENLSEQEKAFGNYDLGRWVWIGSNHRVIKEVFEYKNGQGYYLKYKGDLTLIDELVPCNHKMKNKELG
jgi:hypothetical protein